MGAVAGHAVSPTGRPFMVADPAAMPDDGNRARSSAAILLRTTSPRNMLVLVAPFAVQTAFDSEVRPDVLVAR